MVLRMWGFWWARNPCRSVLLGSGSRIEIIVGTLCPVEAPSGYRSCMDQSTVGQGSLCETRNSHSQVVPKTLNPVAHLLAHAQQSRPNSGLGLSHFQMEPLLQNILYSNSLSLIPHTSSLIPKAGMAGNDDVERGGDALLHLQLQKNSP